MSPAAGRTGLWPRGNPVRLLVSARPWSAAFFLASYVVLGTVLFVVALTTSVFAAGLSITLLGIPLLVAVAYLIHGCAQVERERIRLLRGELIEGGYEPVAGSGILAALRSRWTDPATWRCIGYLVLLYPPLLALDTAVFALWLGFVGGITVPLWYHWVGTTFPNGESGHGIAVGYFPHGPDGSGAVGFWIGSLPAALLTSAVCLVLLVFVANQLVIAAANLQTRLARALLGPPVDPLAAAKAVLAGPGPLG
jgi:Putative sensor